MAKSDSYDGFSALAHSIRRSTAAFIAMQVTEPGSSIEEMLANADEIALWIGGHAAQREQEEAERPSQPLGQPWPPPAD